MLPAIEGLKHVNNNLYGQRLAEHPEEYMLRMQMEELALIDKFEKEEEGEYE